MAAAVALATDRLAARPAAARPASNARESPDIGRFITPITGEAMPILFRATVAVDPFQGSLGQAPVEEASSDLQGAQTYAPVGRRLTAILVADDRRVAVIDDAAVSVGDMLRDGARVSAIQRDRVWLVSRSGQWRMLTLTEQGH